MPRSKLILGEAGLEPASREAQDPKSCVSANFTTRPLLGNGGNYHKQSYQQEKTVSLTTF